MLRLWGLLDGHELTTVDRLDLKKVSGAVDAQDAVSVTDDALTVVNNLKLTSLQNTGPLAEILDDDMQSGTKLEDQKRLENIIVVPTILGSTKMVKPEFALTLPHCGWVEVIRILPGLAVIELHVPLPHGTDGAGGIGLNHADMITGFTLGAKLLLAEELQKSRQEDAPVLKRCDDFLKVTHD